MACKTLVSMVLLFRCGKRSDACLTYVAEANWGKLCWLFVEYNDLHTGTMKVTSGLEHRYGIKILPSSHRRTLS